MNSVNIRPKMFWVRVGIDSMAQIGNVPVIDEFGTHFLGGFGELVAWRIKLTGVEVTLDHLAAQLAQLLTRQCPVNLNNIILQ